MDIEEFIHEAGGDVDRKRAVVEEIRRATGAQTVQMVVRILDPSTVGVNRVNTILLKIVDEVVVCALQPRGFPILLTVEFVLSIVDFFGDKNQADPVETVLNEVKVGDELVVLHIFPALHPGKYCNFGESRRTG